MKTSTMPPLRVDPALRTAVENALHEGETLSTFMEEALRSALATRKIRQAFLERALASGAAARASGEYYSAESVLQELDDMLAATAPGGTD